MIAIKSSNTDAPEIGGSRTDVIAGWFQYLRKWDRSRKSRLIDLKASKCSGVAMNVGMDLDTRTSWKCERYCWAYNAF